MLTRKKLQADLLAAVKKPKDVEALVAALDRMTVALEAETRVLEQHKASLDRTAEKLAEAFIQAGLIKKPEGQEG